MKKIILLLIIGLFVYINSSAQTNVTGGIYSNQTWTTAGSPYIISDTVKVFQSITLTIQPGVVVKFNDGAIIEVAGDIYSNGLPGDSILFTTNDAIPREGMYQGIFAYGGVSSFTYSRFRFASIGLFFEGLGNSRCAHCLFDSNVEGCRYVPFVDTCIFKNDSTGAFPGLGGKITHSDFFKNIIGINSNAYDSVVYCIISRNKYAMFQSNGNLNHCMLDSNTIGALYYSGTTLSNCTVNNNGIGILQNHVTIKYSIFEYNTTAINSSGPSTIESNNISNNGLAITTGNSKIHYNNISDNNNDGIRTNNDEISCNTICDNTPYNIVAEMATNELASNNYWCLTDSAAIQATIYDGYQNINYGLIFFTPFDTIACANTTAIQELPSISKTINLFPDPNNGSFTIQTSGTSVMSSVEIYNMLGKLVNKTTTKQSTSDLSIPNASKGVYLYRVISESGKLIGSGKFVVE